MARKPKTPPPPPPEPKLPWLVVRGARHNNLKNVTAALPLQRLVVVTGVSGSGKSSLVNEIIRTTLEHDLNAAKVQPGESDGIEGIEHLDECIAIDQSPIGRTPRSNPATYTKIFDLIRDLYCDLPESKLRGYKPGRFSFNVTSQKGGGRCENCEGNGSLLLDMDFLADVWVPCAVCEGRRFTSETLAVKFKEKSIADVLELEVAEALALFGNIPKLEVMLRTLHDVGLDYIKLGQPAPTLSGGEAQRVKLAKELCRPDTGRTLYILDEPTTGLHFEDVRRLLDVLHRLVDKGNSVVVIEHHMDVIKQADWILDLGPEGGDRGGTMVAEGTPEQVARVSASHTGPALRLVLDPDAAPTDDDRNDHATWGSEHVSSGPQTMIQVRGASQNNLKHIDVDIPRGAITVACGLSGSGKSTLAMDTIYTEGQRRYVESLSGYARQFLGQMAKPKVESITGLSPAIAIEQKNTVRSPRSTVGTVTEIHDYMRVVWARLGVQYCPDHPQQPAIRHTVSEVVKSVQKRLADGGRWLLGGPVAASADGIESMAALTADVQRLADAGTQRFLLNGQMLDAPALLAALAAWTARELPRPLFIIERLSGKIGSGRIAEAVELAWRMAGGWCCVVADGAGNAPAYYGLAIHCPTCRQVFDSISPQHFSFNTAIGWCPACQGLGVQRGADVSAFVDAPAKPIMQGAVSAWGRVDRASALGRCLTALHDHLRVPVATAWNDWPAEARQQFLQGTGDVWIAVPGEGRKQPAFAVQWKGFFPAVDAVTRASWMYRHRLSHLLSDVTCRVCDGSRLNRVNAAIRVTGADGRSLSLHDVSLLSLEQSRAWFDALPVPPGHDKLAADILSEVRSRLAFLVDVGLGYLSLARNTATLSGGESQRVQLASQVGRSLTGVLYVLDEPTIGLHPADNARLIAALKRLRDMGNTLLIVEHEREVIAQADYLLELGPGAGREGGEKVAAGKPQQVADGQTLTGRYLSGKTAVPLPAERREVLRPGSDAPAIKATGDKPARPLPLSAEWLSITGVALHNLKKIDVNLPLNRMVCLTGVSGSGKSSLVQGVIWPLLASKLHGASLTPGPYGEVSGIKHVMRAILVDQSPIGNTPTSTPVTYVEAFDPIRELYARMPEARKRGWKAGRFSFNRAGGRCEPCEGMGQRCIEMHFLPDVWVTCEHCNGRRYTAETLEVKFRGKSIADALEMRISEAAVLFDTVPNIARPLKMLAEVGLGYLQMGQPATTLSGGEAQRVKLAAELGRQASAPTFYLLDEPTTGLHFDDVRQLILVIQRLVDAGHSVLTIEHNLDVIKCADWVLELGPGAGEAGGSLIAEGTPEEVAAGNTPTAPFLRDVLAKTPARQAAVAPPPPQSPAVVAEPPTPSTEELLATIAVASGEASPAKRDRRPKAAWQAQLAALKAAETVPAPAGEPQVFDEAWHVSGRALNGATWAGASGRSHTLITLVGLCKKAWPQTEVDWSQRDEAKLKVGGRVWARLATASPKNFTLSMTAPEPWAKPAKARELGKNVRTTVNLRTRGLDIDVTVVELSDVNRAEFIAFVEAIRDQWSAR